jgi:hypothetical protein
MGLATASIIVEGYGAQYGLTRPANELHQRLHTLQKRD